MTPRIDLRPACRSFKSLKQKGPVNGALRQAVRPVIDTQTTCLAARYAHGSFKARLSRDGTGGRNRTDTPKERDFESRELMRQVLWP